MIKVNNELMQSAYNRWKMSDQDSIWKAYDRPSDKKVHAWEYCKDLCRKYNGKDLKVIGHSCHQFSAGFIGEGEDEMTGEVKKIFVFITKSYNRYMEVV